MQFGALVNPVEPDLELLRKLMEGVAADPRLNGKVHITPDETDNLGVIGVSDYSKEDVAYHLNLLLIEKYLTGKPDQPMPIVSGMTLEGKRFLDATRNSTAWGQFIQIVKGFPKSFLPFLVQLLEHLFEEQMKKPQ